MSAADRRVSHPFQAGRELGGLALERLEGLVLDLVFALHLPDEELGVGDDLELVDPALYGTLEAGDQAAVLRDVVRGGADRLPPCIQHPPVPAPDGVAVRTRAR